MRGTSALFLYGLLICASCYEENVNAVEGTNWSARRSKGVISWENVDEVLQQAIQNKTFPGKLLLGSDFIVF